MEKIRILTLINSYPPTIGGAERLAESLATEFSNLGHINIIVTRWIVGTRLRETNGHVLIYRVPVFGPRVLRSLMFRILSGLLMMVMCGKYDVIHAHSLDSPAVVGVSLGRSLKKKLFVTIHNIGKVEALRSRFKGQKKLARIIEQSEKIISINRTIGTELTNAGCPENKIVYITNGVNTDFYSPLSDEQKKRELDTLGVHGRIICIFVGNLHSQKGIDTLLEAWALFKRDRTDDSAVLYVLGDGVLMGEVRARVRGLAIGDSVRVLGSRSDVHRYLQCADIFILPSRWEGLSIALLEALACAAGVITTPVGGNIEVIENNRNGVLVPVDDKVALAEGIGRLAGDRQLVRTLGKEGRKTVIEKYSIKRCAGEHLRIFSGLPAAKEEMEKSRSPAITCRL